MSLKQDYYDGSTGFNQQMASCFAAGSAFVSTNEATLTTELQAAAAAGKKTFTVSIVTSDSPAYLRLNGLYAKTYLAGVVHALALEEIYSYECTPTLNLADTVSVRVEFNFTF
jgi:hypothetical protein